MHITLRSHRVCLSKKLRHYSERRLIRGLDAFDSNIAVVQAWLIDGTGLRAGQEARCRVRVELRDGRRVVCSASASSFFEAVETAVRRSRSSVERLLAHPAAGPFAADQATTQPFGPELTRTLGL